MMNHKKETLDKVRASASEWAISTLSTQSPNNEMCTITLWSQTRTCWVMIEIGCFSQTNGTWPMSSPLLKCEDLSKYPRSVNEMIVFVSELGAQPQEYSMLLKKSQFVKKWCCCREHMMLIKGKQLDNWRTRSFEQTSSRLNIWCNLSVSPDLFYISFMMNDWHTCSFCWFDDCKWYDSTKLTTQQPFSFSLFPFTWRRKTLEKSVLIAQTAETNQNMNNFWKLVV